jgi:predicted permease
VAALAALLPVFALIAIGLGLRASGFLTGEFWRGAERFTYFVAFPALLFREGAKADFGQLEAAAVALVALGPVLCVAGVLLAAAPAALRRVDGRAYGSLFQGAIRPNTYLALAVAAAVGGEGPAAVTAAIVLVIPNVNVLSVVAVTRYGGASGATRGAAAAVARNPLILSSLAGLLAGRLGLELPGAPGAVVELLARPALPLGLLAVGAALQPRTLRDARSRAAWSVLGKLVVMPLLAGALCAAVGLAGAPAVALVAYAGMPASPSSYVLARELGGDADLMAALITAHTIASAATLPAVLALGAWLLGA